MTYYINPMWFYLMNVASTLQVLFSIIGSVVIIFTMIATFIWIMDNDVDITGMEDSEKKAIGTFKKIIATGIVLLFIGILVPSKETCVEMMIASQVTHENVTATKESVYEIIDYIMDKAKMEGK